MCSLRCSPCCSAFWKNYNIDQKKEKREENSTKNSSQLKISSSDKRRSGIIPSATTNIAKNPVEEIQKFQKDERDEQLIIGAIARNEFLNKVFKGQRLQSVIEAMYETKFKADEIIIREGEKGSHLYVSVEGTYEISSQGKMVITFDQPRVFGELAILYNAKRSATIKAVTEGRVWVLDRVVYQTLTVQNNIKEQDEILEFLQKVPKLSDAGLNVLQKVSALLKSEFFPAETQIIKQGEKGDKFYIIRAGTVTVTKDGEGEVAKLGRGKYFGELALLKEDIRQATVTADALGVECLTLERQYFIDHLGKMEDIPTYDDGIIQLSEKREDLMDVEQKELNIVTTLGVGGFGRVELVQHSTGQVFALKYLKKYDMVELNQQEHVINERQIQMGCRSDFIVRLYKSFKDRKYIYFLMEACLGGDVWTSLHRERSGKFPEKTAKFVAGCVLEAFGYLHQRGIVYRDLKPENLMIDEKGYVKLTDFGFAKELGSRGRTFTFAGTPEYVAPEIILNKGYDKAADYWAFGILIFELLSGKTPFRTNDSSHMRTYNKILMGIEDMELPFFISEHAMKLIRKLCKTTPTDRLGCQKQGVKDIEKHKWFKDLDWDKLKQGQLSSPFRPMLKKLKSKTDTRYFPRIKMDKDDPPEENSGWDQDF